MTIPKTKSHVKFYIFLLLIIVGFIINSCRKDSKNNPETTLPVAISQAKTWYESAYPVNTASETRSLRANSATNSSLITNTLFDYSQYIKPDWQHAANYTRLGSNVIEMPIVSGTTFGYDFKNNNTNKIYSNQKYNRAYFLLLNNGKGYQAYVMLIMADSAYVKNDMSKLSHTSYRKHDADFSGMVAYFTPTGQYVSGCAYVNGQLITASSSNTSSGSQINEGVNNGKFKPINDVAVAEVCTAWYADYYWNGEYWFTDYLGTTCTPSNTSSGSPAGSSGSNPPPPPPPQCPSSSGEDDAVAAPSGHFHVSVAVEAPPTTPPPGDGGSPPPEPCIETSAPAPPPANTPLNPAMVKDLLSKMHTSTLSADELVNFTTTINQMDATVDGDAILSALDAYYIKNPTATTLTVTDATPVNGTDDFDPNSNTINMGSTYQDGNFASYDIYNTAHEMYHEYETINGQSPYQSNFELDAYMFATQVIEGVPSDFGTTAYETQIEVTDPTTTAQTNFNTAWGNFLNGNTTTANYAILDNNFLSGSKVGPNYTIYNGQTVTNSPSSTPLFETN